MAIVYLHSQICHENIEKHVIDFFSKQIVLGF